MLLVPSSLIACSHAPAPDAPSPQLEVRTSLDSSQAVYVEGFLPYVRVAGEGMDEELEVKLGGITTVDLRGPDDYVVESWVRPCDGNCDTLDPATDHCSQTFSIEEGEDLVLSIQYRAGHPCRMIGWIASPTG